MLTRYFLLIWFFKFKLCPPKCINRWQIYCCLHVLAFKFFQISPLKEILFMFSFCQTEMGVSCTSVYSFWTEVSVETIPFAFHISTATSHADANFIQTMIAWPAVIKTQGQLPAAMKAKLMRQVLVRRDVVYQVPVTWEDGALTSQSPSEHLSAGRGFYEGGGGGRQDRGIGAGVEQFCTSRSAQSVPIRASEAVVRCASSWFLSSCPTAEGQQVSQSWDDWRRESVSFEEMR